MKINDIYTTVLVEANVASKIKDPNIMRSIRIAVNNDPTIPYNKLGQLGKRPDDQQAVKFLSDVIDAALSNTEFGDIAKTNKYDMWLIKKYMAGAVDYEDIVGEADTLAKFHALGKANALKPEHTDINKFRDLQQLSRIISGNYRNELARLKDEEKLKQMKKDKRDIVLINDGEIFVSIPLNYGACYFFNNGFGVSASYCTGSSSGQHWVNTYMPQGLILNIFNIQSPNEDVSKYQIHAATNQIKSASQSYTNSTDKIFAAAYPGLLPRIAEELIANAEAINKASQDIKPGGYDVHEEIKLLKAKFPLSMQKEEKEPETAAPTTDPYDHIRVGNNVVVDFGEDEENEDDNGIQGETVEILEVMNNYGQARVQDDWGDIHILSQEYLVPARA
jgi:hypothetical protein